MHTHHVPSKCEEESKCVLSDRLDGGGGDVCDQDVPARTGWEVNVIGSLFHQFSHPILKYLDESGQRGG